MVFRKLPGIWSTHQWKHTHARTHTHTQIRARAYTQCVAKCRVSWCSTGDTYNCHLVLGRYTNGQKNSYMVFHNTRSTDIIPYLFCLCVILSNTIFCSPHRQFCSSCSDKSGTETELNNAPEAPTLTLTTHPLKWSRTGAGPTAADRGSSHTRHFVRSSNIKFNEKQSRHYMLHKQLTFNGNSYAATKKYDDNNQWLL